MMEMDGWQDHLHFALLGEHVLFPGLRLESLSHFVVASFLTVLLCLFERALTYAITKNWSPFRWTRRSRLRNALWKAGLYWLVTFDRLLYMLVAMTFSAGLIVVMVTALTVGQFFIEYAESVAVDRESRKCRDPENVQEPLLSSSPTSDHESNMSLNSYNHYRSSSPPFSYSHRSASSSVTSTTCFFRTPSPIPEENEVIQVKPQPVTTKTRPRSKSKPSKIFIHPNDSNLARADAAALQLGLAGDTELVKGCQYPQDGEGAWTAGQGKDIVREIMGTSRRSTVS